MSDGVPIPRFRTLTVPECEAILERNHVGRIAYEREHRVDLMGGPRGRLMNHSLYDSRRATWRRTDPIRRILTRS